MNARVVKVGGRAQGDPSLARRLGRLWADAPGELCVVHGGGDEISTLQKRMGGEPVFSGGRRVTTPQDLEVVRMVLSGTINKRLVSALLSEGARAVGISGEDGGLLQAELAAGGSLGRVGTPTSVDPTLLHTLLRDRWLPVVSPVAREMRGDRGGLNVNGDDAAASIAIALAATELLLIADVPGVLVGGAVVNSLDAAGAEELVRGGTAAGGMAAKLEAATFALAHGVGRVRIGDITTLDDDQAGTTMVSAPLATGTV